MKSKSLIILSLLHLLVLSCTNRSKNCEYDINQFYLKNKIAILDVVHIIENDSLFFLLINFSKDTKLANNEKCRLSIMLKNKFKNITFYGRDLQNIDSTLYHHFQANLKNDSNFRITDLVHYNSQVNDIKRIILLLNNYSIYSISAQKELIEISLDAGISLIYLRKSSNYEQENIKGMVFKNIENQFYYYYNPNVNGFF